MRTPIDLVRSHSRVIAARGTHIADHRVQGRIRIFFAQAANFVVDITGLNRTAAGAVDSQDDTLGLVVFKCGTQARDDVVGAALLELDAQA